MCPLRCVAGTGTQHVATCVWGRGGGGRGTAPGEFGQDAGLELGLGLRDRRVPASPCRHPPILSPT
jgi:hypothetical protein